MLRSPRAPRRGTARTTTTVLSAALIAAVSALAAAFNSDWSAPPRYDGAGYAVLARALLEGQGYRAIDHPDRPRHAHFPPGYPLVLAATWRVVGVSMPAARAVSLACTVGATLLAWCWFRRILPATAALLLALALAVNWLWARTGASIQSEPLYLLLSQLAILVASRPVRDTSTGRSLIRAAALGTLLAAAILTRHVAVGLALGVLLDQAMRGRWREALVVSGVAAILVAPWVAWIASVGPEGRSQASLVMGGDTSWIARIAGQFVFYVHRIPDQITGPFVEVGTTFSHNPRLAVTAHIWAVTATAVVALGWLSGLRRPRRRLAGLVALGTLAVLLAWPFPEAGRLLIPLIPCLLIGAEGGLSLSGRKPGDPRRRSSSRRHLIASALILAASLPYSLYATAAGKSRVLTAPEQKFDAACVWLAAHADRPGPVLTRHPGEVFWRTGRQALEVPTSERPGDIDADAASIARTVDAHHVAYLLIDQNRYAHAPPSPLSRFVGAFPERVRDVWQLQDDHAAIRIYEVVRAR